MSNKSCTQCRGRGYVTRWGPAPNYEAILEPCECESESSGMIVAYIVVALFSILSWEILKWIAVSVWEAI